MHRSIGLVGLTFLAVSSIIGSGWMFALLLAVQHAGALGPNRPLLDLAQAALLIPYLLGIELISYFGGFGGTGAIAFGWDILFIAAFSVAVFVAAVRSRLPPEKAAAYLSEEHRLEPDLDRPTV